MDVREGGDIFAQNFIEDLSNSENIGPSIIQKFYENSTIFITGGTGFIGKLLVEKLLRSCSKIKMIYILIRPKNGKEVAERFGEFFQGPLFDRMKLENLNFVQQVNPVCGDCTLPDLGLSPTVKDKIVKEVDIIFHAAAAVRFEETLRSATTINVKGTKRVMLLCKQIRNLKAMVHVSTAYSNCPTKELQERFYRAPINYQKIMNLVELLDDKTLQLLTPNLLDQWPNTYTYTKLIAENVVQENSTNLPVGIIRPSIVISTAEEPIAGWVNNLYGPQGIIFGVFIGLLRTLHCKPWVLADMVPADYLINATIAFAWDLGQTRGDNANLENPALFETLTENDTDMSDVPILNYVSSEKKPISWRSFIYSNQIYGLDIPSVHQIWFSGIKLTPNYYVNVFNQWLLHMIPALIFDGLSYLAGKQPTLWNAYEKIHKFSKIFSHFFMNQWKFHDDNVWRLWDKMSAKDKEIFNFDIGKLDLDNYFYTYIRGLRIYMLKDEMRTVSKAKRKLMWMKITHYSLSLLVYLLLAYITWYLLRLTY